MKKTGNYDYIDVARGILIIWVVLAHVLWFIFNIDDNIVVLAGRLVRMPLFFVLSGFLSYSDAYTSEMFTKRVRNRLYRQLWPTILIFILYITMWYASVPDSGLYYKDFVISNILDANKGGYWFTIVLVEVFMIFALCSRLIYKRGLSSSSYVYLLILSFAIRCMEYKIIPLIPVSLSGGISLIWLLIYSPFFFIGVVFRIYYDKIEKYAPAKWSYGILFLSIVVTGSYFVGRNGIWCYVFVPMSLLGLYCLKDYLTEKHRVPSVLKYIGKRTLPIYLFHYFLIFALARTDFAIFSRLSPIAGNLVALLMTFGIIYLCIAADIITKKHIPSVHNFIFSPLELRERMSLKAARAEQKN